MTKILVVDDERETADTIAFLFERLGHEVKVAYSGLDALPLAAEMKPHIVFLDLFMDGIDGFSAARQIRDASPATDHPFMVALTGQVLPDLDKRIVEAGFDVYLMKPVDFSVLIMMVDSLLSRQHPSASNGQ